ncbi:hypothetical protein CHS0354_003663 [Potamilus streckersoni]|uniref:Glycosyltransferase 2-like domain-containing protein n=1 Tax=Potamilus streckersoni TaxID=2493646 RepID=A0AAE0SSX0_9BIVA|nr:hypothetical protein CHS0354_003663 [Potamilus streckersoni]
MTKRRSQISRSTASIKERFSFILRHTELQSLVSLILHAVTVLCMIFCIILANFLVGFVSSVHITIDPIERYGYIPTCVLYILNVIPVLSVPFAVMSILRLVLLNLWSPPSRLKVPKSKISFLCFRVVTRGLFPYLITKNVQRNIETCYKVGLSNFKIEVVTDNQINLPKSTLIREIVVPRNYCTPNGSLFKARALHYCLEKEIDKESIIGLANFAAMDSGCIGQGVITYANEEIVNWWTTLADSVRVAVDLGMMKFSLKSLNCPAIGFKGSYILVKQSVEKEIGFDFGPKGSTAEDIFFAFMAWQKGYFFNFVEGEMWEISTFTIEDYIKQRKRWFIGHMYALLSTEILLKCKLILIPTDLGWLLLLANVINIPCSYIYPTPMPIFLKVICTSIGGLIVFLFVFGSIKSFSIKKYGLIRKMLICTGSIAVIPLAAMLDGVASLYGFLTRSYGEFHIVRKEKLPYVVP